ncbi:MAG: flagellar export protein FliJ [Clostridium sp.]|nr:flagellar export protein FliJ [Clostridium sp.]MCM1547570.1 flagellar export protein FliJ [Ruminococcus sp.]
MKKFVFSMQKMRDYKKQILESEKNNLMALRREKNELEEKMEQLENIMEELRKGSNDEIAKGTTASRLMFYSMQMDGVKRDQTQTTYQINFAEMKIEKQRRKVVNLSQELSGLDKLEEQQREEYRKLEAKENETAIEEFLSFKMTSEG